ncbi:MAG: B12-binding domain-containing protein, partial [Actinomycetota bacterium]|nr:B12-binding domain-containing protein [Actinomycetota bacterium]
GRGAATASGGSADDAMPLRGARGGPGGRVLAVPGASPEARGLARSVTRLDAEATSGQISDLLVRRGAEATWSEVLVPVLQAVGHRWERTGAGVEIEHVLSEALIDAIRGYCGFLPSPAPGRPVLLASAPEEAHTLPLHILRAALTERRVGSLMVGGRVPIEALSAAARRTGARRVFIWRQTAPSYPTMGPGLADNPPDPAGSGLLPDQMTAAAVLGGDGWSGVTVPASARWVPDLTRAIRELTV